MQFDSVGGWRCQQLRVLWLALRPLLSTMGGDRRVIESYHSQPTDVLPTGGLPMPVCGSANPASL